MEKNDFEKRKKIVYEFICDDLYVPMKLKELAGFFQVKKEDREELKEVLDALIEDNKIEITAKEKYRKSSGKYIVGTFEGNARGFGFVIVDGQKDDIFIPIDNVKDAFNGDKVSVAIKSAPTGRRKEGEIVKILSRGITEIVGTYQQCNNFGFVVPDNSKFTKDVFIPSGCSNGADNGQKVVVKLKSYGDEAKKPEGVITDIIGYIGDPGTDIISIIKSYNLPVDFPIKVMNQANKAPQDIISADMAGRLDARNWQTVTIDGEDAKDLDDAITLTKKDNLYILGVHIADVTNYVQENSALDNEALKRGTSVYLVDRVIPMLPRALSNGICSLNEGEDRLTLSCIMKIDSRGNVVDHTITEAVINVNSRMTYTSVKKILEDNDKNECEKYSDLVPMFKLMEELAAILRRKRHTRGSIDFDFPETKMILDENGKPVEIKPYDRNTATKIIEDFMLIANETVAEDYFWQEMPFVYRTHENPDADKIKKLSLFINNFGYSIHTGQEDIHPKELQKLLEKIEGSDSENLISRLTLRSMKQARYTTSCSGHFGLAARYYCHFTSPIRRYPDLQIHRIIKDSLRGRMTGARLEHYGNILDEVAKHSSVTERRAEEVERETIKQKKAEYMSERIGNEYEGVISGMNSWGIYVELPNTIEGMVHISTLYDDFYEYNENIYEMVGENTNKRYKLGQHVKVKVVDADLLRRTIDFMLI